MAHSIIPHHHDFGLRTDPYSPCRHECEDCSLTGHPEGYDDDPCCALNMEVLVPGKSARSGEDLQDTGSIPGFLPSLTGLLPDQAGLPVISSCSPGISQHENASQYLFLLSSPRGLRAPPLD